ncbi:MAG: hypothetical protein LUG61_09365 [Lachnospiraceae bacterium]|nr:hypothetical protein [Lachnospiraceae bacterium]
MLTGFLAVVVVVALVTVALPVIMKNILIQNMAQCLQRDDLEAFDRILDGRIARMVFQEFDRENLRLNACLRTGDSQKIKEQYQAMLNLRLRNVKQEKQLVMNAFSYFINNGEGEEARQLFPRLKQAVSPEEYERCRIMYRVIIKKQSKDIETLEEQLIEASQMDQSVLHYLLSLQYGYLGNTQKEQEHLELARQSDARADRSIQESKKG